MGRRGFTLVEIIVVVAIITILAVVIIPKFLLARHNANESVAIATLKTYLTSLENYRAAQTPPEYPPDLTTLGSETPPYVDELLSQDPASKEGYTFTYGQLSSDQFQLVAQPEVSGVTGTRVFFVDQSGVIRLDDEDGTPVE